VATDIRKDGVIRDFEPYWAFDNNNIQLAKTNSTKWVWNSEITQYNRKGAELEDHDPLGRYNAGIYGYQESLPVAVVSNSRLRLAAFDGFEDYSYKDDPCEPYCKPSKRHFPTGIAFSQLDETQSHTGRYSLRVDAGQAYSMNVKVSAEDAATDPDLLIRLNKTPYQQAVLVTPKGIGLKGYYYNNPAMTGTPMATRVDAYVNLFIRSKNNNGCNGGSGTTALPVGVNCGDMSVVWKGKVQVITGGSYQFASSWTNDGCRIYVNNTLAYTGWLSGNNYAQQTYPVYLLPGQLYDIRVEFQQYGGVGEINMIWQKPGSTQWTTVDPKHLYPEGQESLANGSTVTQTVYCEKPDDIQAVAHHLIDSLNLIGNEKMVVSAWVRKGSADCKCSSYSGIHIKIKDANGNVVAELQPKEKIIEGWQQYETVFDVPASGDKIKLEFNAPADAALYTDDLRLHPYHANMKSFVYDPLSLRLTAELDENNYASFYEYDDDGTLVRTKKETRQGIKTITETRSASQKSITDF